MKKLTKEFILQQIKNKAKELNRVPYEKDVKEYQTAIKLFGSWINALSKAGIIIRNKSNKPIMYTKEEVLELFIKKAEKLKRSPKMKDFDENPTLPSATHIEYCFGDKWNNILKQLNLSPNYSQFQNEYTDQELLIELKKELIKLGSTSCKYYEENRNKNNMPCQKYILKRFKMSWKEILHKIDI